MVKSVNAHCSCSSKHKGSLSSAKGLFEKREFRQLAKKKKRMPISVVLCCCGKWTLLPRCYSGLEIFGSAPHFLAANFSHVFKHGSKYEIPAAMLNIQELSGKSLFRSCQASHCSGAVRQVVSPSFTVLTLLFSCYKTCCGPGLFKTFVCED